MNIEYINLSNAHETVGKVAMSELPNVLFTDVKDRVNLLGKNTLAVKLSNASKTLAGQISNQIYWNPHSEFNEFIHNFAKESFFADKNDFKILKHDSWINFQKKHEYNPIHTHSGNLSYVIWIQIPYYYIDEDNFTNTKKSIYHNNGRFEFVYCDKNYKVGCKEILADKNFEGKIIIFPSDLCHCVYPFYTSDEYRISVAGNIWV